MEENQLNFHHQEDNLIIEIMMSASRAIGYIGDDYQVFCVGNFLLTFERFGMSRPNDIYAQWHTTLDYYYATKKYFDRWGWLWQTYPGGATGSPAAWCLQSKGPDLCWARSAADGGVGVFELDRPYQFQYDPTNGTVSLGNIVRSGP
jgi:hypothetical protein